MNAIAVLLALAGAVCLLAAARMLHGQLAKAVAARAAAIDAREAASATFARCGEMLKRHQAEAETDACAVRAAIVAQWSLLERAESFISGFEDDETQLGVRELLADLRGAIGSPTRSAS